MKILPLLLFISLHALAFTRRPTPGNDGGAYLISTQYQINPGDTVVLSGNWTYFSIEGYHGTLKDTIAITGTASLTGVSLKNCSFIKVTGSLKASSLNGSGTAINVSGSCSNLLIENVQVYHTAYGVWIKNEVSCDTTQNYPNLWLSDIELRNCTFKNIGQDCIYAGSTGQLSTDRPIVCSGITKYYIPSRLRNISIHDNVIDSCNRTGIQLSGAMEGVNLVYNNQVSHCGYELVQNQGTGISVGGMTHARVFHNRVNATYLYGIMSQGIDTVEISDNIVDSSGWLNGVRNTGSYPCNIVLTTKTTDPYRTSFAVVSNNVVVVNATNESPNGNISFANWGPAAAWSGSFLCNNLDGTQNPAHIYMFSGFPDYSACDAVLPVHLISFVVEKQGSSVLLKWSADALSYDVERSLDGRLWRRIATLTGNRFTDVQPLMVNFYRLKMHDQSGYSYSPIRFIRMDRGNYRVQVYNCVGQRIGVYESTEIEVLKQALASGVYFFCSPYGNEKYLAQKIN